MSNKSPLDPSASHSLFGANSPGQRDYSKPEERKERLDFSRMRLYPQGVSKEEAIGFFKATYHIEPTVIVQGSGKGFGWAVGLVPEDFKEEE